LFTDTDVLPHKLGAGSNSFKQQHHHSVSTQQSDTIQQTDIPCLDRRKLATHCHGEMDSSVTHKIEQLNIIDHQTDTTNVTESSHGVTYVDNNPDECTTVNGTTLAVPIAAHHPPSKTIYCTSLFIDMVDWLSIVVVGNLDGKVGLFTCSQ